MSSTNKSSSNDSYIIQLAEPRHSPDVLRIMRDNFYHEENMFRCLCSNVSISDDEMKRIDECFDDWTRKSFARDPCLVAICKNTLEVVGVNVTAVTLNPRIEVPKNDAGTIFKPEIPTPPLVEKYAYYLARMNDEADVFGKYPEAEVAWEFYAIAIDKNHRRLGLAKDLTNAGIALAKESKASMVFGIYTSMYSTKAAANVGMKSIMEFRLSEYEDEDGAPVFGDCGINDVVHVMVLQL